MLSSASKTTTSEPPCPFPRTMASGSSFWALPLPYLYLQRPHLLPHTCCLKLGSMLPTQPHSSESCLLQCGPTIRSSMSRPTRSPPEKPSSSPLADSSAQASPPLEANLSFSWDPPQTSSKICKVCGRPKPECQSYLHRPPQYECQTCGKQFFTLTSLGRHMEQAHAHGEHVKCPTCLRVFKGAREFEGHKCIIKVPTLDICM